MVTRSSEENRTTPSCTVSSNVRPSTSVRRTRVISAPASSIVPAPRSPRWPQFPPRSADGRPHSGAGPLPPAMPLALHRPTSSCEAWTVQRQRSEPREPPSASHVMNHI